MKTLLILALAITLNASEWRDLNTKIEESGYGYVPHYVVGGLTSYYTYELLPDDMPIWSKTAIALTVPLLIGVAKESTDKNFDTQDALDYGVGGVIGMSVQWAF